jgi:RNA-binding protein YhbY
VEDGDVIIIEKDGVLENVNDKLMIKELIKVKGESDNIKIKGVDN